MYRTIAKNGARITVKNWPAFCKTGLAAAVVFNEAPLFINGKQVDILATN